MMSTLLEAIAEHQETALRLRKAVQRVVRAKAWGALDTRWKIYTAACNASLLPYGDWVETPPALEALDVSWYDDFYADRYVLVKWLDIIENIEDNGPNGKFYDVLNQLKEEILELGQAGFHNDW
jgi:hypothetical protein